MSGPSRPERPAWRRLVTALLVTTSAVLLTCGIALAHANLVRSDPAAGASLASSPARIQMWFSEALEPSFSQAVIYDTNRQRVDLGDSHLAPNDPQSLIVGVKPNLPKGTYVVAWVTQSRVDGHVVRGTVPFGVGVAVGANDTTAASPVQGPVSGSPLEMSLRWLVILAASALVGSFAFWIVQSDAARSVDPDSPGDVAPIQRRLAIGAWAVFLAGNLALLLLQTSIAADVSLTAIGRPLLETLTQTQYGGLWIARVVLGVGLGLILFTRGRLKTETQTRTRDLIGLAVGALTLLSISLTSHSASVNLQTPIGVEPIPLLNDWLHLAAVAMWIGGLFQLAVLLPVVLKLGSAPARAHLLGSIVPRFSVVAGICLGIVGVTGVAEGLIHVGTLDNLLNKDYGQALIVKNIFVVPLLVLAAVNHFLVLPSLQRGRNATTPTALCQAIDAAGLLKLTVRIEVAFAVAVIAAVGVMTSLSPAQQLSTTSGAGPVTLVAPANDLQVTLGVSPGRPGPNQYVVDVRNGNGQVPTDVERVSTRFTFLDSDLGVSEVVLTSAGNGRFTGQSSDLSVAGRWQVEVIVRRPGQDDARATYGFSVTPSGAETLQAPQMQVTWMFFLGVFLAIFGVGAVLRGLRLRPDDLRRGAIVAFLGIGLVGGGLFFAVQDIQLAQAQAASQVLDQIHPATPQSIANGAIVYRQNCAMCHGLDAHGTGPLAPSLNPRPADLVVHIPLHPDVDLEDWIANGYPGSAMPAFKDKLSEQDRWDVLNYLKTVASNASGGSTASPTPSPTG